jgi:tRNA(fMet)-specific endonuclease VapC
MPDRLLVDTNIAIYLAKGHRNLQPYRTVLEGNILALGFVNAAELLLTARRAHNPEDTLAYWRERLPHYVVLFPDLETCEIWADIAARCYAKGRPRQDNDLWTAALALRYGLPLVTHNRKHFEDIEGLTIISRA